MNQRKPKLRCCASCQWIFRNGVECPKCGFGSYGARYVFGDAAYRYEISQKPWFEAKLASYSSSLYAQIRENQRILPSYISSGIFDCTTGKQEK